MTHPCPGVGDKQCGVSVSGTGNSRCVECCELARQQKGTLKTERILIAESRAAVGIPPRLSISRADLERMNSTQLLVCYNRINNTQVKGFPNRQIAIAQILYVMKTGRAEHRRSQVARSKELGHHSTRKDNS